MVLNFKVEYSPSARKDLLGIHDHITNELMNPEAASRYIVLIISSADSLAVSPKRCMVRKKDSKGREIRIFPVKNYLIIYYVDDDTQTVNILRVVYSKRNLDEII